MTNNNTKENKWVYETSFHGRRSGAIGISEWHGHTITSDTPLTYQDARLKLYDNFEHITAFKIHKSYGVTK
jgi:hypothetical protein|tara:strand:+ start:193 stop:405 length:213 start_codon:yes stop_codon:yes gene_type:complete